MTYHAPAPAAREMVVDGEISGLTPHQERVVALLAEGPKSLDALARCLYGTEGDHWWADAKATAKVVVCVARRKLAPHGLTITRAGWHKPYRLVRT